jgi:2-haloacid dehalogenase
MDRRSFVGTAASLLASARSRPRGAETPYRVVALDGFAVFDATTVVPLMERYAPGRGRELVAAWRSRMFDYQWLRTLGGRYADFQTTAADGLATALAAAGVSLEAAQRRALVDAQLALEPWPDAADALTRLRAAGLRLALLSNMTAAMLSDGARRAGIGDAFDAVLSTDRVRAAKPDPRAYRMALDAFGVEASQVVFVAFAGWDAAGAAWFGYPTVWMNRAGAVDEQLGIAPMRVVPNLSAAAEYVTGTR